MRVRYGASRPRSLRRIKNVINDDDDNSEFALYHASPVTYTTTRSTYSITNEFKENIEMNIKDVTRHIYRQVRFISI